jgi:hypothetical protein
VTTQITAALRAYAAGFYSDEAGTELLISHGGFLHQPGFTRFVDTFASVTDGTPMAQIDWQSLHSARYEGHLPLSGLLTELPDVSAAQVGRPSPRSIVGVSERSRSQAKAAMLPA